MSARLRDSKGEALGLGIGNNISVNQQTTRPDELHRGLSPVEGNRFGFRAERQSWRACGTP